MNAEQQNSVVIKKQWGKVGLRCLLALFSIYLFVFTLRFIQLNFTGKQIWTADSVPRTILPNLWHDFPEAHENWEIHSVPLQIVDLAGDFKQEFITHTSSILIVYALNSEGRWQYAAGVGFVEKFVYLPFTLWGYPTVLLLDKAGRVDGFFQKID